MRILTVNTMDRSGGAEKLASDLVTRFRKTGHPTTFAVGRKRGGIADIEFPQDREYLPKNNFAPRPAGKIKRNLEYSEGVEDFNFPGTWDLLNLESEKADLLHLHNLHGGYFDLRALPWLSKQLPTVLTLHDAWLTSGHCAHTIDCDRWLNGCGECPDLEIYPSIPADGTAFNWKRKSEIIAASRLHIVTPSRWLMDQFRASVLWPHFLSNKVIPNGVDNSIYYSGSKYEARDLLGLPVNSVILLSVFNVIKNNPFKDFDASLRVVNWLSKRHTDRPIYWICIGSKGPNTEVGNATAIFVPYQNIEDVLATFYRAADIFLHIALADTFPNVVLEALCCGCPVASTSVGGIPEQIKSFLPLPKGTHGAYDETTATGLIVRPGDERELVNQLAYLLDTPELLLKLANNAAKDGKSRFDTSTTVQSYLDWFSNILDDQSISYEQNTQPGQYEYNVKIHGRGKRIAENKLPSGSPVKSTRNAPLILMYHRVTDIPLDPQLLTVKPSTFKEHLKLIRQISVPISLSNMVASIDSGHIPWNSIAVTFDDGYADNFIEAFPLLSNNNVPATIFGVSDAINNKKEFWWDHLENILLTSGILPPTAKFEFGNVLINMDLEGFAEYTEEDVANYSDWTVLDINDPTPRHTLYRNLYSALRSIQNFQDRADCLDLITNWANKEPQGRESHRTLTFNEIKTLGNSGLVEIGAHTASHPVLSSMSIYDQEAEITSGRKALEGVIGQPINVFAYPYGDLGSYTKETAEILKQNAFKGAVTTLNASIDKNSKIFELPRITIRECTTSQLLEKLTHYRQQSFQFL